MLLTQTFINIGGISGLIPSTGVTFPFLSQGGNSLWVLSIAVALVLNIDASEKRALATQEAPSYEKLRKFRAITKSEWVKKGSYHDFTKLESYTNKEIIKEEAEILTTILEDIAKKFGESRNL